MAESYIRLARDVNGAGAEELFAKFPQLEDSLLVDDPHIVETAQTLAAMVQRHAATTLHVLETMIERHRVDIAAGRLRRHLSEPGSLPGLSTDVVAENPVNQFSKSGNAWLISFDGRTIPFADSKGLHYIQRLIRYRPDELHVLQLTQGEQPAVGEQISAAVAAESGLTAVVRTAGDPIINKATLRGVLRELAALRSRRDEAIEREDQDAALTVETQIDEAESLLRKSLNHKGGSENPR